MAEGRRYLIDEVVRGSVKVLFGCELRGKSFGKTCFIFLKNLPSQMRDWTSTTLEGNATSVMKLYLVQKKSQIKGKKKMLLLKYCPVGTAGLLTRFTCARLIRSLVEDDLSRQHFRGGRWRAPRVWGGQWGEWGGVGFHKPLRPLCSLSTVIDFIYFLAALEHSRNSSKSRRSARGRCGAMCISVDCVWLSCT